MRIYDFEKYKEFIAEWIQAQPRGGRGLLKQIAERLRVHPSLVSQIVGGTKDFSPEQANELAGFMQLDERETEYLLCLVEIERAGTVKLRSFLQRRRKRLAEDANRLVRQFQETRELSTEDRSKFFSHWQYSAIHLLTDIPRFQDARSIANFLKLDPGVVEEALSFLKRTGLVQASEDGRLQCGETWIFEPHGTANSMRHHINWRLKAMDRLQQETDGEVFLTLPVTISEKDRELVRGMIREFVSELKKTVEPSKPEQLSVITIDLFDIA